MKYYYFVSFQCENNMGNAVGNITFDTTEKIREYKDVKSIQDDIEKTKKVRKVTIINIVLLDNE